MTHQVETNYSRLLFRLFAHSSIAHCWLERFVVQGFQEKEFSYSQLICGVLYS